MELPGESNNATKNARCTQARKTTHGLDGQHAAVVFHVFFSFFMFCVGLLIVWLCFFMSDIVLFID